MVAILSILEIVLFLGMIASLFLYPPAALFCAAAAGLVFFASKRLMREEPQ